MFQESQSEFLPNLPGLGVDWLKTSLGGILYVLHILKALFLVTSFI
uniref:Uncharacterized protein n=1 Tax=Rhizophora mucronata TaxID=61149 RepID=A0A2P2K9I0_RHIMU